MKELSIEEKAKAYDEAIEKARKEYKNHEAFKGFCEMLVHIFPELKESEESEDERIRKGIISYLKSSTAISPKTWIAWLEKQGNLMKALRISNARIGELIEKNYYLREQLENQGENTYNKVLSELLHKVICTFINDPDIPYFDREKVSMEVLPYVERLEKQGEQEPKFRIGDTIKKKSTGDIVTVSEVDLKNREYRLSNTGFIPFKYEYLWELVEQKPVWSEEDEMFVHGLIRGLAAKRDIHGHTTFSSDCIDITETINWLKSLKDRYTWKPSDEQLTQLKIAVSKGTAGYFNNNVLRELYEQLKQL